MVTYKEEWRNNMSDPRMNTVCGNCGFRRGHHREGMCYPVDTNHQGLGWASFRAINLTRRVLDDDPAEAQAVRESNHALTDIGDPMSISSMDRICGNCGIRFGWHRANATNSCPPHAGSSDWDAGPGTEFADSGFSEIESDQNRHRQALNLGTRERDMARNQRMNEACGVCGQTWGAHRGSRCPPLEGVEGVTIFEPTGITVTAENPIDLRTTRPSAASATEITAATWIAVPGQRSWIVELSKMGIPAMPITLVDYGGLRAMAFPAADLDRVRSLFTVSTLIRPTADPDILLAADPGQRVEETGPNMDSEASEVLRRAAERDRALRDRLQEQTNSSMLNSPRPRRSAGEWIPVTDVDGGGSTYTFNYNIPLDIPLDIVSEGVAMTGERRATSEVPGAPEPQTPVVNEEPGYTVFCESKVNMENLEQMRKVFQEYATSLKLNIKLKNPHSEAWDGRQPAAGTLRVLFWCSPLNSSRRTRNFGQVFGYMLESSQNDGYYESQSSDWEIRTPEGDCIAEVIGNTMFVLCDIPHGPNSAAIVRNIMAEYAKGKPAGTSVDVGRDRMFKLVKDLTAVRVAKVQETMAQNQRNLDDYFRHVQDLTAKIAADKVFIENTQAGEEVQRERCQREFDRLLNMAHVVKLYISGAEISITTDYLPFTYKKRLYQGHEYTLRLLPKLGKMFIRRADSRPLVRESYAHPHVNGEGTPCFGNISKAMFGLLSQLEFAALTQILIEYLQVCNESDWYSDPIQWPKEPDAELVTTAATTAEVVVGLSIPPELICPNCSGHSDECGCWRCGGCGEWFGEDDDRCSDCDYCFNCCGCHEHDDDED
jgi:hypothetical protein